MDNWAYFDNKYGKPFGKGAQCHVYRKDDLAIKVLTPGHQLTDLMREAYALAIAESLGVPTSNLKGVYRDHDHLVMEMKYVTGKELMDVILDCVQRGDYDAARRHGEKMADMQITLHSQHAFGLVSSQTFMRAYVDGAQVDDATRAKLVKLVDGLPDGTSVCHNDYHARNILYDGENYTVIDWDSATIGDPAGDVAHTFLVTLLTDEQLAKDYLSIYLDKTGMDRARLDPWLTLHALILYAALYQNEKSAPLCERLIPYLDALNS